MGIILYIDRPSCWTYWYDMHGWLIQSCRFVSECMMEMMSGKMWLGVVLFMQRKYYSMFLMEILFIFNLDDKIHSWQCIIVAFSNFQLLSELKYEIGARKLFSIDDPYWSALPKPSLLLEGLPNKQTLPFDLPVVISVFFLVPGSKVLTRCGWKKKRKKYSMNLEDPEFPILVYEEGMLNCSSKTIYWDIYDIQLAKTFACIAGASLVVTQKEGRNKFTAVRKYPFVPF